jgi:hypothetical protein
MAQALIQPGKVPIVCPLVDPLLIRQNRQRYLRDEIPELAHANAFFSPSERWPARGWVLVQRGAYNLLNLYATNLQLQIDELSSPTSALTIGGVAIVQARCVSRGLPTDPQAVYLVELTDARGVLSNSWAEWPTTSQFNIRAPAYPQQFYTPTTLLGTPWTWAQMIGALWNQMPLLGPYPGIPTAPAGIPEGFSFPGVSCWQALNDVLDLLGLVITYNPLLPLPYGIAVIGAADATFAKLLSAYYAARIQDDLEYIDPAGSGRVPGSVNVYFHRRNQFYGTEETVRMDGLQWQATPLYAINVPGPAPYNQSPGLGSLWCEFTVQYDVNNVPLAADVATAAAIAAERVAQYYAKATRNNLGYLRQVYAGALPLYAGTTVDGIAWKQDRSFRQGWRTEAVRGPMPPFAQLDRSEG